VIVNQLVFSKFIFLLSAFFILEYSYSLRWMLGSLVLIQSGTGIDILVYWYTYHPISLNPFSFMIIPSVSPIGWRWVVKHQAFGKFQGADANVARRPVTLHAAGLNRIRVPAATCLFE
jgi:hypothetical protein